MTAISLPLPSPARRTAFGKVVLNEARLTWRRPVALIAGLALPVLLLVIFGEVPAFHQADPALGGLTAIDLYVPILAVFSLAMLALVGCRVHLQAGDRLAQLPGQDEIGLDAAARVAFGRIR